MYENSIIISEILGSTAIIWLNRPEQHNALNGTMITEFLKTIKLLNNDPGIRVIMIQGKGPSFCAGADLLWMQQAAGLATADNFHECLNLAGSFYAIATSPKVTVALVHGAAYGGAGGFVAASDLAYAAVSASFTFSEVRLGLIPATIAPYVLRKISYASAMELMLTGRKFSASEAEQKGLVNKALPDNEFYDYVHSMVGEILLGGPNAQEIIKTSLNAWKKAEFNETLIEQSALQLAETRITPEAAEGISAFLEKRPIRWIPA